MRFGMIRQTALTAVAVLALSMPAQNAAAQTFSVKKYDIGGEGGTDYLTPEAGSGRVLGARQTHVMVVDANTGAAIGDIPDTPREDCIWRAPQAQHSFTTNARCFCVTTFDLIS